MERTRSHFAKLSSRAVLLLGGVGLAWLIVAGLLILQLDAEGFLGDSPEDSPSLTAVSDESKPTSQPEAFNEHALDSLEADEPALNALAADSLHLEETEQPKAAAVVPKAPESLRRDNLKSPLSHPSLRDAADEPIMHEMAALFDAIQVGLERPGATIDPSLSNYVDALVARMNANGEPLVVHIRDHDLEVVRRRAVRAHALLVEAGLRPWLLEVFGERGAAGVSVERG